MSSSFVRDVCTKVLKCVGLSKSELPSIQDPYFMWVKPTYNYIVPSPYYLVYKLKHEMNFRNIFRTHRLF